VKLLVQLFGYSNKYCIYITILHCVMCGVEEGYVTVSKLCDKFVMLAFPSAAQQQLSLPSHLRFVVAFTCYSTGGAPGSCC
jgi:hypothetical protein